LRPRSIPLRFGCHLLQSQVGQNLGIFLARGEDLMTGGAVIGNGPGIGTGVWLPSWQRKRPGESLWPRLFGCAPHVTRMSGKDVARVDVRHFQQKGRMMEHSGQLGSVLFSARDSDLAGMPDRVESPVREPLDSGLFCGRGDCRVDDGDTYSTVVRASHDEKGLHNSFIRNTVIHCRAWNLPCNG
jgi:hypothetical protein